MPVGEKMLLLSFCLTAQQYILAIEATATIVRKQKTLKATKVEL